MVLHMVFRQFEDKYFWNESKCISYYHVLCLEQKLEHIPIDAASYELVLRN